MWKIFEIWDLSLICDVKHYITDINPTSNVTDK